MAPQTRLEATHDSDRTASQTNDVVPDGTRAVAIQSCCVQSRQSGSLGPVQERTIPNFFSASPLAVPGEVLQVLWFGMHDVEMGR
jgi:hypothetical protein